MFNFFGGGAKKKSNRPERRKEARIDTSVDAEWRFKPVGKIASAWSNVVINDLSRSSATMVCERALKPQEAIEIRTMLDGKSPFVMEATCFRCEPAGSKFRVVMNFRHVDEESSHVITRFINRRMTELRGRGLI